MIGWDAMFPPQPPPRREPDSSLEMVRFTFRGSKIERAVDFVLEVVLMVAFVLNMVKEVDLDLEGVVDMGFDFEGVAMTGSNLEVVKMEHANLPFPSD
ncbi:hypothetical protein HAX54_006333 [Datura stramonium]|uniref:Uncharacterized protein n=1 Tax=Datura stramonium TaxID=4076 RepID=A0ABS8WTZ4_DATST|nr:hypothetical protein [Datura stramonium]